MERRFEGRTAVVTAASRGIGLGIARRLVADGARVVVTARKKDALDEAVAGLGGPGHALAAAGRADDPAHQAETVRLAVEAFGSLDLLVNNAGINPVIGPLIGTDLVAARKTVEVNCFAALAWTQQAHRAWMAEHGGAVVNVSSVGAVSHVPNLGVYGASKAMLAYLTSQLALELGPGVRVNAVAPAVVKTRFAAGLYEGREDEVASLYPLRRLGMPADVADVVGFLLSDEAGWVTGQQIVIDGGVLLAGPA